uniref:DUF4218 domain-containing protein n=1 Tax=Macrostomum lignano TaxID=282301 RepID=A0A1I8ICG4_9PLAT
RRPRRIDSNLMHMKATEFRQFVLYLGPALFKGFMPARLYKNFLLLHFAIYCYSSNKFSQHWDKAKSCIEVFVEQLAIIFGPKVISFNVHALLHLDQFVRKLGGLNNFSTFPFENFLGAVKRKVKVTRHAAAHAVKQVLRVRLMMLENASLLSIRPLKYSRNKGDNCCFIGERCVLLDDVSLDGTIKAKENRISLKEEKFSKKNGSYQLEAGCTLVDRN